MKKLDLMKEERLSNLTRKLDLTDYYINEDKKYKHYDRFKMKNRHKMTRRKRKTLERLFDEYGQATNDTCRFLSSLAK